MRQYHPFSSKDGQPGKKRRNPIETTEQKEFRLREAANKKVRQLSGWNIFVKQALEGQSHTAESYTAKMKLAARDWNDLPDEDKLPYAVEAEHQESLRACLKETPIAVGQTKAHVSELERQVGKSGSKKFSARRLMLNMKQFETHPSWNISTCFGDSFFGQNKIRHILHFHILYFKYVVLTCVTIVCVVQSRKLSYVLEPCSGFP